MSERLVPGWWVRAAIVALGLVLLVAAVAGRATGPLDLVPGVVLLALAAAAPGGPLPAVFLVVAVGTQLVAGSADADQLWWRVPLQAALLHAVHVLCALAAAIPVTARVEARVLRAPARRWALAQLLALPVMATVAMVATTAGGARVADGPWILAAGAVAATLAALPAILLLRHPPRSRRGG